MKVYVIMRGEYSDKHICGVAIDPDVAEEIKYRCSDHEYNCDQAYIEEYETDEWSPLAKDGELYHVERLANGTINCNEISNDDDWEYDCFRYNKHVSRRAYYKDGEKLCVDVIALNRTHAKKIAIDKFTQFQAMEAGI